MSDLEFISINEDMLSQVKKSDSISLYNLSEQYSLYPLYKTGHHQFLNLSAFYQLSKLKTSCDITYVGCDIHLKTNYEKIKEILNLNIKVESFPWSFLYDFFTSKKIESCKLKPEKIPLKYNGIFLSGNKRFTRYHIMSELSEYPCFTYSNFEGKIGNLTVEEEKTKVTKEILDYSLSKTGFLVTYFDYETNVQEESYFSGDDLSWEYLFHFKNYNSSKPKYFNVNLDRYVKPFKKLEHPYLNNIVPDEYLQSAVIFACESQTDISTHITEKTFKNIFYKKPYLTFASKGFYKFLTENDFVLYDELFDYSFDDIDDYGERLTGYLNECKKVLRMDLTSLKSIISIMQPKLDHNYNKCCEIVNTDFFKKYINKYREFSSNI